MLDAKDLELYSKQNDRGVINNRKAATQVKNFAGLRYERITPTDIDGYLEFRNICHVLIETKHGTTELPFGQRLALERMCDDLNFAKPGRVILILTSHNSEDTEDIDMAAAKVIEVRWNGKYYKRNGETTKQCIDKFLQYVASLRVR